MEQTAAIRQKHETAPKANEAPIDSELLERHLPLVQPVVNSIARHLPTHIDTDDLHSVGVMGLIAALRRYDATQEKTFNAYAKMRIRGAILDELRRLDSLPRTARNKARRMEETVSLLEQRLGRAPTDEELRKEMRLSSRDFNRYMKQVRPVVLVPLDKNPTSGEGQEADLHEAITDEDQESSATIFEREELIGIVSKGIEALPDRQRKILSMCYFEGFRLDEIAEAFGVTQARICQIRTQAIRNIRKHMSEELAE